MFLETSSDEESYWFAMRYTIPFLIVMAILLLPPQGAGRGIYRPGDWISYTNMRHVTSIAIGHRYVYFGTTGGIGRLLRYERSWDAPMTTSDGLPENEVKRMAYEPGFGELWVETQSGHVCHYQPTFEDWIYGGTFPTSLEVGNDEGYQFPFLFMDFGYYFSRRGIIGDQHLRDFPITTHVVDDWNNLWIGTWGLGAGVGDLRARELKLLPFGLVEEDVAVIALDGDEMWFGGGQLGSGAITRYNRGSGEWTYFEARYIDALRGGGVNSIVFDTISVWLGTNYGVGRFHRATKRWSTISGLRNDRVTDLAVDGDDLWVGTTFGLNQLNSRNLLIERTEDLANRSVYDVEVGQRSIWVGTEEGVFRRSRSGERWRQVTAPAGYLSPTVMAIDEDGDDVWFGLLPHWGEETFFEVTDEKVSIGARSLSLGHPPHVFFFLSVYHQSDQTWERYFPPEGLTLGAPHSVVASQGLVWVGTTGGALRFDTATKLWRLYTVEDGLVDNHIQALLLDGDYIWFGSRKGATRFLWNSPDRVD